MSPRRRIEASEPDRGTRPCPANDTRDDMQRDDRTRHLPRHRIPWLSACLFLFIAGPAAAQDSGETRPTQPYQQIQRLQLPKLPIAPLTQSQQQRGTQQQNQGTPFFAAESRMLSHDVRAYLQMNGVPGSATEADYRGWVVVLGFEENVGAENGPGRQGAPARSRKRLTVSKFTDSASVALRHLAVSGQRLSRAQLAAGIGGTLELYRLTLEDVIVTDIRAKMEENRVVEEVDLDFRKMAWQYRVVDSRNQFKGTQSGCWDFASNRGC